MSDVKISWVPIGDGEWDVFMEGDDTLEFGDTPGHDFHGNQWTEGYRDPSAITSGFQKYPDGSEGWGTWIDHLKPTPGPVEMNTWFKGKPEEKDAVAISEKLGKICQGTLYLDPLDKVGIIADRGKEQGGPVEKGGSQETGKCHWNAARLWLDDPERYKLVSGYALVSKARLDVEYDEKLFPDNPTKAEEKAGTALYTVEQSWLAHSWVRDTQTGALIETTPNRYDGYFGAELTPQETLGFIKDIGKIRVPKEVKDQYA
jgi:hypothetical protein